MKKIIILCVSCFFLSLAHAEPTFKYYAPGEKTVFDITYFGAIAGVAEINVLPYEKFKGQESFHFLVTAKTTSFFSLFYRLNNVYESFFSRDKLFSLQYKAKVDETKQQRAITQDFDQSHHVIHYIDNFKHYVKGEGKTDFEKKVIGLPQDAVSAVFYIRTLPLKVGGSYDFPLLLEGEVKTIRIKVVREEVLQTSIGDFPAFVLQPEVWKDGIKQPLPDSFFWLSNDNRRRLLKVDAKVKVGSIIGYLKATETVRAHKEEPDIGNF